MDTSDVLRERARNDLLVELAFRTNRCVRCCRAFEHDDPVYVGVFSNGGYAAVGNCCLMHLHGVGGYGDVRFGQVVWTKVGEAAFGTPGMRSPGAALDALIAARRIHRGEKPDEDRDSSGDYVRL